MFEEIVSVEWLKDNLTKDNLVILDSSPKSTVSGKTASIQDSFIPNARIFDIKNNFSDKNAKFPNTIPSESQFEEECQLLGINTNSEIVVYDNLGIYTSPRVWWLFKTMGHSNVKVLNGGLVEWLNKGYDTVRKSDLNQDYKTGDFKSNYNKEYIVNFNEVNENINSKEFTLIDARSKGRFDGSAPEPRKHLKSGNVPGSINIPFGTLLENGKFKSKEELEEIFKEQIKDQSKLVFSCGSGLTACIVILASEIAFRKSRYLYDGSWTEYAELNNLKNDIENV